MTEQEKKLLLQDLCARLSYGVKVAKSNIIYPLTGIDIALGYVELAVSERISIEEAIPYLRPMSSMTEEEKKEFIEYAGYEIEESVNGRHYEYYLKDFCGTLNNPSVNADSVDWFNKKMFDYRGLIPKGLALEAPEGMYK